MMAIQGVINSALGNELGIGETNFIVHSTASLILLIYLLFNLLISKQNHFLLSKLKGVSWYLYLGGFIGVIITYEVIMSISKVGARLLLK